MIKIGVIGLGMMGEHHARIYSQLDCELVGIADQDPQRAEAIGEKYGTPYYTDYRDLLDLVDAVSVVVPTSLHREVAGVFLERGIHCLVEKPLASTLQEAEQMVEMAAKHRAKLAVGHIERFNPAVQQLKKLIDQKALGQLMIVSIRRVGPFADRIRDVGVIIDSASHDIDIARYLIGSEPVATFCKSGRYKHQTQEDHAIIILDFGQIVASIEANWFTPTKTRAMAITGSEGTAYLNYISQSLTLDTRYGKTIVSVEKAEPLKLELENFLECVRYDHSPLVTGYDGLQTLRICLAAASKRSTILDDAADIVNTNWL